MKRFGVRYGGLVKGMTAAVGLTFLAVIATGLVNVRGSPIQQAGMIVLPALVLVATALFAVLRYEVDDEGLHVVRPIGHLRIAGAVSAIVADDAAAKGAIRTFGNGGVFSFTGYYRLPKYGHCRFWVTDLHHLVVIHGDRGCVVISPIQRDAFIAAVKQRFGVAA